MVKFRAILVAVVVLGGMLLNVVSGQAEPPSCYARADAPHVSNGANGIIAKTRFICESGKSIVVTEALMNLYLCPQPPSGSENGWTTTHGCRVEKSAHYFDDIRVSSGRTVTRYVPPLGESGATGAGYWVQCTQYFRDDNPGVKYRNASVVRQINY